MERIPLEWILDIPPITRCWTIGIIGVSILDHVGVLSPLDLFYSTDKIFKHGEYHRLLTCFLYFGRFSIDLMFSVFLVARSSRSLEESLPHTKDYLYMIGILGFMTVMYSSFVNNLFSLGPFLDSCLLYIWARRNANIQVSFLGLIRVSASYLPFFYSIFGLLLRSSSYESTIVSIIIGHIYYFFSDIFPRIHGFNILTPPWYWDYRAIRDTLNGQHHALNQNMERDERLRQLVNEAINRGRNVEGNEINAVH